MGDIASEHQHRSQEKNRARSGNRPVVLVFCDFYLPGYKSGGSMRTLVNMIERLGGEYDFRVVTRDHDGKTDRTPYSDITVNEWNPIGPALVKHLSKDRIRPWQITRIIREVEPDSIYFNSYFSTFTFLALLSRRIGKFPAIPMIVAPEGEITDAGLKMKKGTKKRAFIASTRALGIYENLIWKTTSELEAEEVRRLKVRSPKIFVAPNLSPKSILPDYRQELKPRKVQGRVRLVYLSRIHPKKNLDFLLEILRDVSGNVDLTVFGPIDADDRYVDQCRRHAESLPRSVSVVFKGGVDHPKVASTLFDHEFFILPTRTENFGHVFLEGLAAGCPLVISDRTPWTDLQRRGIGWDIPLENREQWIEILERCIEMDDNEFQSMSKRARAFAEEWLADDGLERATRNVIEYSLRLPNADSSPDNHVRFDSVETETLF